MLDTLMQVLRSFWIVWVMVFFSGVVLWAYWPRNRAKIEAHGDIPLRNDL